MTAIEAFVGCGVIIFIAVLCLIIVMGALRKLEDEINRRPF